MMSKASSARYARQVILPGVGFEGQGKLLSARVLMVGAGGLGCPALQYLVAAGVGTIGIVDHDTVSLSNLQRQTLYATTDLGKAKALVAAEKLKALNPDCHIVAYPQQLDQQACLSLFPHYDLILDGTDNFATRYMINDACVLLQKPLVYGAVSQYAGQVALFNTPAADGTRGPNYRHLFPKPPQPGEVQNCAEAGVLGVLPGIIGGMMAAEAIKWLLHFPKNLSGKLLTYDLRDQQIFMLNMPVKHLHTIGIPKDAGAFLATDYVWLCEGLTQNNPLEITWTEALQQGSAALWIDLREPHEQPRLAQRENLIDLPVSIFEQEMEKWVDQRLLLFCQSGKRSLRVVQILKEKFPAAMAKSIQGGIMAYYTTHTEQL